MQFCYPVVHPQSALRLTAPSLRSLIACGRDEGLLHQGAFFAAVGRGTKDEGKGRRGRRPLRFPRPKTPLQCKTLAAALVSIDKKFKKDYNEHRKGTTGRRLAPSFDYEVTASLVAGRLLLFIGPDNEADNSDDDQTV
jgi:hypothetical protein